MRRPRIKVDGEGFYHVVSRIGGRRFLIDEAEKSVLLGMIRAAAAFSGVEMLTFAIMSNHFHLLVRVPARREVPDAELLRRMEALYGGPRFRKVLDKWEKWSGKRQEWRVEEEKARLRARMYDLSQFCKTFKEAYTQDYNRRHDNTGTIWEGRFKSMLVEGSCRAMMTVAGYIHLNPVRAGVVKRAEDAGNAGFGAACRGDALARGGLVALVSRAHGRRPVSWDIARDACAAVMRGAVPTAPSSESAPSGASPGSGGGAPAGQVGPLGDLLNRRVAGFLNGGALGASGFVRQSEALLPRRVRKKSEGLLDRCAFLGLNTSAGVREVS